MKKLTVEQREDILVAYRNSHHHFKDDRLKLFVKYLNANTEEEVEFPFLCENGIDVCLCPGCLKNHPCPECDVEMNYIMITSRPSYLDGMYWKCPSCGKIE